jgi:hypothetical protein
LCKRSPAEIETFAGHKEKKMCKVKIQNTVIWEAKISPQIIRYPLLGLQVLNCRKVKNIICGNVNTSSIQTYSTAGEKMLNGAVIGIFYITLFERETGNVKVKQFQLAQLMNTGMINFEFDSSIYDLDRSYVEFGSQAASLLDIYYQTVTPGDSTYQEVLQLTFIYE